MKARRQITPDEIITAGILRARGRSFPQIAKALGAGISAKRIRLALFPPNRNPGRTNHRVLTRRHDPPPEVLEARDAAKVDWELLTISQRYLGDPKPGRSALDMKRDK